jgi:hypothetical protein
MTVFRKLRQLGYLTSYSHRGKYYTLLEIPEFDEEGLWSWQQVWFSRYGSLEQTVKTFVEESQGGWTAQELDSRVHVETKQPLLKLVRRRQIVREKISGVYVYFSGEKEQRRSQGLCRQEWSSAAGLGIVSQGAVSVPEMKAAIVLFYSLLNEKQRRLYAGLEAMRQGHGGDRAIAQLLGLDVHTIAKGRRELFEGDVEPDRVRSQGGGRKAVGKKRPKS